MPPFIKKPVTITPGNLVGYDPATGRLNDTGTAIADLSGGAASVVFFTSGTRGGIAPPLTSCVGYETDTGIVYAATGLGAGNWTPALASKADLAKVEPQMLSFGIRGSSVIATGYKGVITVPRSVTLVSWDIVGAPAGAIQFDVKKGTYAGYPTTASIVAAAPPKITGSAQKAASSTLTGWTTALSAGDKLEVYVTSATGLTNVLLTLHGNLT